MPIERAISKQLVGYVNSSGPASIGKLSLRQIFKEELGRLNVPYTDVCCNGPNNDAPQIFGFRYNNDSWNNLDDFVNYGANVSVVNNKLQFTTGASNYSQKMFIDDYTCLEKWSFRARFTVQNNGQGIAVGSHSFTFRNIVNVFVVAQFNTSTGALSLGLGQENPAPPTVVNATGTLSFSPTDVLEITVAQKGYNAFASIRNVTTKSATISCNYAYNTIYEKTPSFGFTNQSLPNTRRLGIWDLGGDFTVEALEWFVYEPKNANLMVVGDSKSAGFYASIEANSYSHLLSNYFAPVINASGNGDSSYEVVNRLKEIIDLKPKKLLLAIGRVDMAVNLPLLISNYDTITSQCEQAGIEVYHIGPFWEPSFDQSSLHNHIIATYPESRIIDCYGATQQAGLFVDNVHMNEIGHRVIFDAIINSGKLLNGFYHNDNPIRSQNEYIQSGKFRIDGQGEVGTLKITDVSEYTDNAAAITAGLTIGTVYRTGDTLKIVH